MFVQLTNALPALKGKAVLINPSIVVTVHRNKVLREDGTEEEVTYIFTPYGTWEVEELVEVVFDKFNRVLKGK